MAESGAAVATPRAITPAKVAISLIAVMTAVSPFLADFNETHVFNPRWPPHARFHNGQTMTLGLIAGLLSLYFLWIRRASTALENLKAGTLFAALYWAAMAPAILYPGASFVDPEYGGNEAMSLGGVPVNQLGMDVVIFAVLALCLRAEARRISNAQVRA